VPGSTVIFRVLPSIADLTGLLYHFIDFKDCANVAEQKSVNTISRVDLFMPKAINILKKYS
jgi:hypothetical protein